MAFDRDFMLWSMQCNKESTNSDNHAFLDVCILHVARLKKKSEW